MMKICLIAQGFDMGTVPQSHEKRIRQTNRPQVASLLPAKTDFFVVSVLLLTSHYFHIYIKTPSLQLSNDVYLKQISLFYRV
jgi:hypothetical protein